MRRLQHCLDDDGGPIIKILPASRFFQTQCRVELDFVVAERPTECFQAKLPHEFFGQGFIADCRWLAGH